jgi:1-acyl-sn-glycerol-3-phosphate acyltransferase
MPLAERLNVRLVTALNENPRTKRWLQEYLRTFGAWWVHKATEKIIHIEGLERLRSWEPERGIVVAANHRSFFDFYVISSILLRNTRLAERIYFPVRTNFFYESPIGLLVNGVVGGFSMYPPIFREQERRELNEISLKRVEALLGEKGVLVGFHPEGTRGKGPDPFQLLPAQPGVGRVLYHTRVPAIPVFIYGLTNDFLHQLVNGVRGRVAPVYALFGAPVELEDLYRQSGRASTYLRIANRVRDAIGELGSRVKALEQARARGGSAEEPSSR